MALEVRLLQPADDAEVLGAIVRRAYFALPGYPRDPEYDIEIGAIAERPAGDDVVVAVLDGTPVGCLTYVGPHSEFFEFHDPDGASFRFFGVDPFVQGRGVGEAMVHWCIARARHDRRRRLRIHTLDSMPGARRLYERLGFERDPDNDEDWDGIRGIAFVMHL